MRRNEMEHKIVMNCIPVGQGCYYDGIEFMKEITFPNNRKLIVFAYRAYNAFGLIGPEKNGIGILDVTKGTILADEICKESSGYCGLSDKQYTKAQEIASYDFREMCQFVNNSGRNRYPLEDLQSKKRIKFNYFKPYMFIPTEHSTSQDKARFANQFIKFMMSDYDEDFFPKWFYNRLSMCFGHIAHYNLSGFYSHFFTNDEGKIKFVNMTMNHHCAGDPAYTYSDVEKAIQKYIGKYISKK